VLSVIALIVAFASPLISTAVRSARARASAHNFAISLRAVRMLSVMANRPVDITVHATAQDACPCVPTWFEYVDARGQTVRTAMPEWVWIHESEPTIRFLPNGSTDLVATTTIKADLGGGNIETWRIRTERTGVPHVSRSGEGG
jgi:Tfp pilus assembly protein FimT